MRVLMINDYFGFSAGAFAVAWELSGDLIGRGHEVGLLCATQDRAEAGEEEIEGRKVRRLFARTPMRLRPLLTINRPGLIRRAVEWIEAFKPDIIHAHVVHIHLSFGLLRALDQRGWPIILSAHDTGIFCPTKYTCQPPDNPNQPASCSDCLSCQRLRYLPGKASAQVKMVNRHVKEVAAVSHSLAGILTANGVQQVTVVHNGLDPDRLAGQGWSAEEFRRSQDLGDESLILFGGRLQIDKGDEAALRTLAQIDPGLGAKLVVAGKRELFGPRLKRLAGELGIREKIVLAGWLEREAMLGAFRAAGAVLTPSLYPDPFPTINLEAMSLAKPIVGTIFGGTPEIVVDGVTGFLVDPREPGQTAERLGLLLTDPNLAQRMGQAGQERLKADFSLKAQAGKFEELYQKWA